MKCGESRSIPDHRDMINGGGGGGVQVCDTWFPLGLENLEKREHLPVREKSANFAKTGKVEESYPNTGKIRKNYTGKLKNSGKFSKIGEPVMVKTLEILYHILNKKRI